MRTLVGFIALVWSLECFAQKVPTAPILKQSEDLRVQLMRVESEVYGDFHKLRTFHSDLFQSINRSDAAPYPSLNYLFDTLFIEANKTVGYRVDFDTTYWQLKKALEGKSNVKLKGVTAQLYQSFEPMPAKLSAEQELHRNAYFSLR
ncbi:MAG: hypothetical protein ACK478_08305, partial [Flavobacteriales bacterium]